MNLTNVSRLVVFQLWGRTVARNLKTWALVDLGALGALAAFGALGALKTQSALGALKI
jgi:hypothetical protein